MHCAAQYVLQKERYESTLEILDAREGPYRHLQFNTRPLSFGESLVNLCHTKERLIKLRGIDREYIKDHNTECLYEMLNHFSTSI